jgi:hypothetical protein
LQEFLRAPFRHRIEHCVHSHLCDLVRAHLGDLAVIGDGPELTQCVHKEWPTPFPGRSSTADVATLTLLSCRPRCLLVARRWRRFDAVAWPPPL